MFCGEQFPKYLADAWKIAAPNSTIEIYMDQQRLQFIFLVLII